MPTTLKLAADHWWNYPARKAPEFEKPFRQHAAKLYEQAIATGKLVGLNKVQAERRIEEANALGEGLVPEKKALGGVQLWEGGPYWAECNVGASQPEEYGYYFWWGDTVGYKRNASNNGCISAKGGAVFSFSEGSCPTFKKDSSQLQAAGYIDASGNLVAAHDAATAHLGAPWRMPTDADFDALISNCTTTWTTRKGVYGQLVTGKGAFATKSIFLPAAGAGAGSYLCYTGSYGYYWSSTPNSGRSLDAWNLYFKSNYLGLNYFGRCCGRSVRPVRGFPNPSPSPSVSLTKKEAIEHTTDESLAKAKREMEEKIAAQREDKLYCVIDLSGGPNAKRYPVSYLNAVPKGGWTDEYKTTKLVLRRIEPGSFVMASDVSPTKVSISRTFYMGVFEVSQKQFELVCGEKSASKYKGDKRPEDRAGWQQIRGDADKFDWPSCQVVDENSFMGRLRKRTSLQADLPTEVQWEYACRAGTNSMLNNKGSTEKDAMLICCCKYNSDDCGTVEIGSYAPNSWGLYDMHGNVWERCLDYYSSLPSESIDYVGPNTGKSKVKRGGAWDCRIPYLKSSFRAENSNFRTGGGGGDTGFRLAIQPK